MRESVRCTDGEERTLLSYYVRGLFLFLVVFFKDKDFYLSTVIESVRGRFL